MRSKVFYFNGAESLMIASSIALPSAGIRCV
jgi:hypothetical protein